MAAGTLNLSGPLAIEKGARYLFTWRVRNNVCDAWTVQVTDVGSPGDTVSVTVFDPGTGDMPAHERTVTHTVIAGDTPTTVAAALAVLLNALTFSTEAPDNEGPGCVVTALELVSATSSGDTVTLRGARRTDFLAVLAGTTGTAAANATNTATVLIDLTSHTFTSQVRRDEGGTAILADLTSLISVTNATLGAVTLDIPASTTGAYVWSSGAWDVFWDRTAGDIVKLWTGIVEAVGRVTV